jgi:S-methylmethionine-dependent homocysteine/selenocysteine methylase
VQWDQLRRKVIKLDGGLSTALESNGNKLITSLWSGELIRSKPAEIIGGCCGIGAAQISEMSLSN